MFFLVKKTFYTKERSFFIKNLTYLVVAELDKLKVQVNKFQSNLKKLCVLEAQEKAKKLLSLVKCKQARRINIPYDNFTVISDYISFAGKEMKIFGDADGIREMNKKLVDTFHRFYNEETRRDPF